MKFEIVVLVVFGALLTWLACTPAPAGAEAPSPCTYMGDWIYRCVYPDAVCYAALGSSVGGISCRFEPPTR